VVTGYPVRSEILAAERAEAAVALGLDPGRPTVLVAAGSRGARTISEAVKAGVPQLIREVPRLQLIISTGQEYYEDVRSSLAASGVADELSERVRIYPYIHRMDHAYACADLVLSRAGGSTHELLARGLPAILVPSPNVAYDQQRDNALSLTAIGAAILIEDRELTGKRFADVLSELLNSPGRPSPPRPGSVMRVPPSQLGSPSSLVVDGPLIPPDETSPSPSISQVLRRALPCGRVVTSFRPDTYDGS
jgi:UDP-N-acetylglucosamine--N-acetylmuramyl-(pentapeptide) pyrophosphoryl-undecaprenol N-acetylglucosamine transferase